MLAIVDAWTSRQIECRIFDREKYHTKAYLTRAQLDVIGAQALVGSSNFTRPGYHAIGRARSRG